MLQGVEAEIGEFCYLFIGGPDAENATGVLRSAGVGVSGVEVVVQQAITLCHSLIVFFSAS